jgi:hypothetical protein
MVWKRLLAALCVVMSSLSCQQPSEPEAKKEVTGDGTPRSEAKPGRQRGNEGLRAAEAGLVVSILDPRMQSFLRAAKTWRQAATPERMVIDQVCLVPDLSSFLQAIGEWDERSFYPILIDDPAWTLPFLRAFRPRRVVRVLVNDGSGSRRESAASSISKHSLLDNPQVLWIAAQRAVARAWTSDTIREADLPAAGTVPRRLGSPAPGLVLSNPESPMLAGAVALAAGRFQPLVRLDPVTAGSSAADSADSPKYRHFHDVLSLSEARRLARLIESRAEAVATQYESLGDRCDFITLAADWPYRYRNDAEQGAVWGEHALDDLIGRLLETDEGGLATSRSRWAFTGRLLGDPPASVYRAMCSLFLQPEATLLWDTFAGGGVWSDYRMTGAKEVLGKLSPRGEPPVHRAGAAANLVAWHEVFNPVSRFGWIMVNSTGFPRQFSIPGGSGCPADLARGQPAAVSIIHSHSAADPLDPTTLAGRWLENGAFIYFGAMNEPFLHAFRPPKLIAELAVAEIPLAAVLRQAEYEPFGRPWRLVYLGDPLFSFHSSRLNTRRNRASPRAWANPFAGDSRWTLEEITAKSRPPDLRGDERARLQACLSAAISAVCRAEGSSELDGDADRRHRQAVDWPSVACAIDRQKLEPRQRPVLDDLVIDTLLNRGDQQGCLEWLLRISPTECSPRGLAAIETVAMRRLISLAGSGSLSSALDLWQGMIRRTWPAGSEFPSQLTRRLAALVDSDRSRYQEPYRQKLIETAADLPSGAKQSPTAALIQNELNRLDSLRATGNSP